MKKLHTLILVISLIAVSNTYGFDGNRQGFVLGGGLGFAPVSSISLGSSDETGPGVGLNLIIGYAWDEQNMFVYEGNVTSWKSGDESLTQGFNGAAWYHYFGPIGRSAFTVGGLGVYVFDGESFNSNDPGFALMFGAGYEFANHWQFAGYFSFGQTSDAFFDYDHYHMNILISGVAF